MAVTVHPRRGTLYPEKSGVTVLPGAGVVSVEVAAISAALSEDITDESDIVAGGNVITITLTNDTWEATVGADNAITTAIINGLDSAQAEGTGWDAVVKAGLTHTAVARTSATLCTITLPAFATYDITATETITATVPASALVTSSSPVVASPSFTVITVAAGSIAPLHYHHRHHNLAG